ncbi:MAG: hypothetical protein KIS96_11725 [Bauldia sp.]|nr:hypothetical protein [Bauldia sp.]
MILRASDLEPLTGLQIIDGTQLDMGRVEMLVRDGVWDADDLGRYGLVAAEPFVPPEGKRAVGPPTYAWDGPVVRELYEVEDIPPEPPARVMGYTIIARIEALLGAEGARQALEGIQALDPVGYARMISSPTGVAVDDERLIAGAAALGLDPQAILAPEGG